MAESLTSSFMVIAGEASGDALAAELIAALKEKLRERGKAASFFGVGGERMSAAGAELIFDLVRNAVFGLEALGRFWEFKRRFYDLLRVAAERKPDAIICVDFGGFNRRFAAAVKRRVRRGGDWNPKIVQYVSPQVWASRPGRAAKLARVVDLLLTIFPFEKAWYAERVPELRVEFVGHPVVDRYGELHPAREEASGAPGIVLLPGSRPSELKRHLPVFAEALRSIRAVVPELRARMILPDALAPQGRAFGFPVDVQIDSGDLATALAQADVAIAKSGTVTLECAYFGVPTVVMYKTSWATYAIAKRIVQVKYVAMPNLLANLEVFPEFLQDAATPGNIARAALEFLTDAARRNTVKAKLKEIVSTLGAPGASRRAAEAILEVMEPASGR